MTDLIPTEPEVDDEPEFDFKVPENVLIRVIEDTLGQVNRNWTGWSIDGLVVLDNGTTKTGAASYEDGYGGFLEYTIMAFVECPKREGYFVVEGITATVTRGDGWMTDSDMEFKHTGIREATPEEIVQF